MIKISLDNREAKLLITGNIPSGNHNTIPFEVDAISGDIWKDTAKSAVFFVVTKRGEIKVAEVPLDSNSQCLIPGNILSEQSAQLSVSVKGTKTDGSIVASNRINLGIVSPGAGYEDAIKANQLCPSEFDRIMQAIASMSVPDSETLKLFTMDSKKNLYFNGKRIASLPEGGSKGQVLTKKSNEPYDCSWEKSVTMTYNAGTLTIE